MSYRSDIALMLKTEIVEQFHQNIHTSNNDSQQVNDFLQECKQQLISTDGDVLFYWTYKKWEKFYYPVFAIERFMDNLDRENLSDCYLFIRIGEEWDDVEYRGEFGSPYGGENVFYLEAVREIVFYGKSDNP